MDRFFCYCITIIQTAITPKNQSFSRHEHPLTQKQSSQKYLQNAILISIALQFHTKNLSTTHRQQPLQILLSRTAQKRHQQNLHCQTIGQLPRQRHLFNTIHHIEIQCHSQCVIQTYIDTPLLYKNLKFDLRIYALIAGCDPLRIYIYNQGLVRFATQKYQPVDEQNIDNLYMHLTNYAINKDNPKYVFNQSLQNLSHGHKKSLAEFFQTLKSMGLPAHQYWSSIKDIIVKTLISGQPHLQHQYRMAQPHNIINNMSFQILGFDFMIDDKNKVYLLEINYTPSFSTQTPLDHLIKSNLIRDTLILMNINPSSRNSAVKIAKQELDRRVFTGKINKVTPLEREQLSKEYQIQRDQFEKQNIGSFERIYPSRHHDRQSKYQALLQYSAIAYQQSNSPQKIINSRRSNSKYRIKRLLSNHTLVQQEYQQNTIQQQKKQYNYQTRTNNSITKEKNPVFARKFRQKLSYNEQFHKNSGHMIPQQPKNTQLHFKSAAPGQQIRGMKLQSLQTKNEQSTMFSKHYALQTSG